MKPLEAWSIITGMASLISLFLSIIFNFFPITVITYSAIGEPVSIEINLMPIFIMITIILLIITIVLVKSIKK